MLLDHLHSSMDVTLDGTALKPFPSPYPLILRRFLPTDYSPFLNHYFYEPHPLLHNYLFFLLSWRKDAFFFTLCFNAFLGALLHSHGVVHQFSWWVCSYCLKIPYHIWFPRHFGNKLVYQKLLLQLVWYFLQCSSTKSFCNQPL